MVAKWRGHEMSMKKLVFAIFLISSPAVAQTKLLPKSVPARVDNCAPIGRTEDGKLVYSMKCESLQASATAAAGSNQGDARAAPGAGSASQRNFRLVL